ncbi:MAG: ABC-2 family transporter protein [archaeon]
MNNLKAVVKQGVKNGLAYRFDFFVHLLLAPISLIVYYFLWKSIFGYSGEDVINGFTFTTMISYYVISLVVGYFTWSEVDEWIEWDVRHGYLIRALIQPIKYMARSFYFELGVNLLTIIFQAIPVMIAAFIFLGLEFVSPLNFILFLVSVALASVLYFLISFMIGLSAFWLNKIDGLIRTKRPLIGFLSGSMIPLTFFPLGMQAVFDYLPFQYVRFVPIGIYLGMFEVNKIWFYLGMQLAWIIVIYLICELIWRQAFKKFSGVGT